MPDATTSTPTAPSTASANGMLSPSILDSPGTRRAIRDAALAPSLSALDGTTDEPGQKEKLGAAIASGARGNCNKGEFAGGGMGLLSLPFWAIAQLREKCSH